MKQLSPKKIQARFNGNLASAKEMIRQAKLKVKDTSPTDEKVLAKLLTEVMGESLIQLHYPRKAARRYLEQRPIRDCRVWTTMVECNNCGAYVGTQDFQVEECDQCGSDNLKKTQVEKR